jgi:peptide/nickel transport system permease protein
VSVQYLIKRLLSGAVVLLLVSMIAYLALALAPGDELIARIGPEAAAQMTPAELAAQRAALGLDQPIPVRYAIWLGDVLHGDLGYSASEGAPVADNVAHSIGPTVLLVGTALVIGTLLAIAMGVIAAIRRRTVVDYVLSALPVIAIGIPVFVLSLSLIYIFSVRLGLFPTSGMHALGDDSFPDLLRHMALPATVLAVGFGAPILRFTRASMLDVLGSEYIAAARAKGLPARTIVFRHALRNALMPIVTIIGLSLPSAVAGAVIVERIFSWPGMGSLAVRAAGNRDFSMMLGVVLVVSIVVTLSNILTDLTYSVVDPRVRLD